MAYIPSEDENNQSSMNVLSQEEQKQNELDQEKKNLQSGGSSFTPTPTSQPGANITPTSGQSQAKSAGGQGSGTFTNLNKYREANKPAAQKIAGAVQKGTEQQASQIGQQIQQQKSDFQRQVDANRARMQSAEQFAQQQIQQAGTQPETDQSAISRFQNIVRQPNQFTQATANFAPAQREISQLGNLAGDVNRENVRMDLLRRTFGGKDQYTSGQRALDDLLVSGNEQARETIAQAPKTALENLQSQLADARRFTTGERAMLTREGQQLAENVAGQVDTAQQALRDDLTTRMEDYDSSLAGRLLSGLETGNVDPAVLQELGVTDNRLYGVDPSQFLQAAPTMESIATPEDLARAEALARLEGTTQDIILDPTQVGQFTGEQQAELQSLRDAIAEQRGAYESEVGNLGDLISELSGVQDQLTSVVPTRQALDDLIAAQNIGTDRFASQRRDKANQVQSLVQPIAEDTVRGLSELGLSQEAIDYVLPTIFAQGFGDLRTDDRDRALNALMQQVYQGPGGQNWRDSDNFASASRFLEADRSSGQYTTPQQVIEALQSDLTGIQDKYDYGNVIGQQAEPNLRYDVLKNLLDG